MRVGLIAAGFALLAGLHGIAVPSASASEDFVLLRLDGTWVKWGSPKLGTRASVTYALADRRMDSPGARNCRSIGPVDRLLARSRIDAGAFRREVAQAFSTWSKVADIAFREVKDPAAADIVIGAQTRPRGRAYTNVDFASAVRGHTRSIRKSLICLNGARDWKLGFDGNLEVYDLRYTLIHEIGHAIGLDHPGPHGQIMSFRYYEEFRGLQAGDISGVSALYGGPDATGSTRMQQASQDAPGPEAAAGIPQLSLGETEEWDTGTSLFPPLAIP